MNRSPLGVLRWFLVLVAAAVATAGPSLAADPAMPATGTATAAMPRTASPPGSMVFIVSPTNGEVVTSPFRVVFGIKGMTVAPAGDAKPGTGHHHLLIDTPPPALGQPIPKDDNHVHFGKGQNEATVTLPPGKHTLQLLFGDANHVPHDPPVISRQITVFVK